MQRFAKKISQVVLTLHAVTSSSVERYTMCTQYKFSLKHVLLTCWNCKFRQLS